MKIEIKIAEVSHDNLVDLFSTALYGNNKWCVDYDSDTYKTLKETHGECIEDKLADMLLAGHPILVSDMYAEDDEDFYGNLSHRYDEENECMDYAVYLTDVITGLEKAACNGSSKRVFYLAEDAAQLDLIDCDILLQYIVFGNYIYG